MLIFFLPFQLFQSLVPKEKYDKNDVILEVTSGRTTGGQLNNFIVNDLKKYLNFTLV